MRDGKISHIQNSEADPKPKTNNINHKNLPILPYPALPNRTHTIPQSTNHNPPTTPTMPQILNRHPNIENIGYDIKTL